MNNVMSVESLRNLPIEDWVWIVLLNGRKIGGVSKMYLRKFGHLDTEFIAYELSLHHLYYSDYNKTWVAYKNKEQAEADTHCAICHMPLGNVLPKVDVHGNLYCNGCYEAKCELEVLKAKRSAKRSVEVPCSIGDTVYFSRCGRFNYGVIRSVNFTCDNLFFEWVTYDYSGDVPEFIDDGDFSLEDIGKTVFLTEEERDKYLLEEDNGTDED